ncbi:MAG: nucleotidyltransferase family protein [Eubacteriales bacterium]
MAVLGIICEFNPLHSGHKYLLDHARAARDTVVCIMSGNATQRGELAVCDKYYRAEAAVLCGADLVLELPYPWCASSAEFFARGAVAVLSRICDRLLFGSECGDAECIRRWAETALSADFAEEYAVRMRDGGRAAQVYLGLLAERTGSEPLSNDILGIEYMKAAWTLGADIGFQTLKRSGSAYREEEVEQGMHPSATALRKLMESDGISALASRLPPESAEVIERAWERGEIADMRKFYSFARFFFALSSPSGFSDLFGACGGVAERICRAARDSADGEEFFDLMKTKQYTDARLRRTLLFCLTGVRDGLVSGIPAYTNLLAAGPRGRELLSLIRKRDGVIPIVTKPADAAAIDSAAAREQSCLSTSLNTVFASSLRKPLSGGEMLKKMPFIGL